MRQRARKQANQGKELGVFAPLSWVRFFSYRKDFVILHPKRKVIMAKRIFDFLVEMTSNTRLGQDSHKQEEEKKGEHQPALEDEKKPRRSFNDTNSSHPGEYWGFNEMEKGEGIAHSTACKLSKDPYYQPAFRYVGRSVRVDIEILHELQRKKAAEKNKPIGDNPRKHKKTPTL